MYCLELIKFDVSNTSYYVEVDNGTLVHCCATSCSHGKWSLEDMESHGKFF